jgi:hypothetical protein
MTFLSPQAINEYILIYKEEFKKDIPRDKAIEQAENLLKLLDLLLSSNGDEKHGEYIKSNF